MDLGFERGLSLARSGIVPQVLQKVLLQQEDPEFLSLFSLPLLEKTLVCFEVLTQQRKMVGDFLKTNDCSRFIRSASIVTQ